MGKADKMLLKHHSDSDNYQLYTFNSCSNSCYLRPRFGLTAFKIKSLLLGMITQRRHFRAKKSALYRASFELQISLL